MTLLLLFIMKKKPSLKIPFFTAQLYDGCLFFFVFAVAVVCLNLSRCLSGSDYSASLPSCSGQLWRWERREKWGRNKKEGWERRQRGTRIHRKGGKCIQKKKKKELAAKCFHLRSEGTFYLLICTEENRCSLGPVHCVFPGLKLLCFSSRCSLSPCCLWRENSKQQPCRDLWKKKGISKPYIICWNAIYKSQVLKKTETCLENKTSRNM